jgi:hypothetical protein
MATFLSRALDLDVSPRVVVTPDEDLLGVAFDTPETETVNTLTSLLGAPTDDYAGACPYIVPDNMRYLRWGSLYVAIRTVDSGAGTGLSGWRYSYGDGVNPDPGGPLGSHVELPYDLELGDPISDAAAASGQPIELTSYSWMIVDLGYAGIEALGAVVDPNALITGVQQGYGFDCE